MIGDTLLRGRDTRPRGTRPNLVSIITVSYNSAESIARLRRSILDYNIGHQPFEWIIVDNGSSRPETEKELEFTSRTWPGGLVDQTTRLVKAGDPAAQLMISRQPTNLFFTGGNNVGLSLAKGDVVVLLNPDCEVKSGWLERMLDVAAQPKVGVVGAVLVNERGQIVHAGGFGMGGHEGFGEPYDPDAPYTKTRKMPTGGWITGACLMITREALQSVGGRLNPRHRHYHSDRTLCAEVQLRGLEVWMSDVVLVHTVGGSQL